MCRKKSNFKQITAQQHSTEYTEHKSSITKRIRVPKQHSITHLSTTKRNQLDDVTFRWHSVLTNINVSNRHKQLLTIFGSLGSLLQPTYLQNKNKITFKNNIHFTCKSTALLINFKHFYIFQTSTILKT